MKKSMFIIGGILISSGILFGQMMHKKMHHNKDPKEMVKFITKRMVKKLDLNKNQAEQLEKINLKHFEQIGKLKDSHKTELEAILTDEQLAKLEKSPFGKRFGQGCGPMGGKFGHHKFGPKNGFGPMMGNSHGFGSMMGFGPNPEMMDKMHDKMEKMLGKITEERKEFDKKLSSSEKQIIANFKENEENNQPNWDQDISMEERKTKMEKVFQPLLDIADNHKAELDKISKKLESDLPMKNDMIECMKNSEEFKKMKLVRFLLMEF